MANPATPKENSWFTKTKKKMTKAFQSSVAGNGNTPGGTPAPASTSLSLTPPFQNASAPPKLDPTPPKPAPAENSGLISTIPPTFNPDIFPSEISRANDIEPPNIAQRIDSTVQLVHGARLIQLMESPSFSLSAVASSPTKVQPQRQPDLSIKDREWIKKMKDLSVEKDRIHQLLIGVVNAFILDPVKSDEAIREVVIVGPVLKKDQFRALLMCFLAEFGNSPLLEIGKLPGLIQLVQDAPPEFLETNDLIDILELIRKRLKGTDTHSEKYLFQLTLAISKVLSIMADLNIKELNRVDQHEPLRTILAGLKANENPYLRYQAIYAVQALRCVPDDETPTRCFFRHFVNIAGSTIKLAGVVQADIKGFSAGAKEIHSSISGLYDFVKSTVEEDLPAFLQDGAGLVNCLKNMVKSEKRHPWYISLRAAEDLVQLGHFPAFKELAFAAQSHDSYLFQWGICQLLGEVAVDSSWGQDTQIQAIMFLGEMSTISQHPPVKEWILTLLSYISTVTNEPNSTSAAGLLHDLKNAREEPSPIHYFVGRRLSLPESYPLLFKVNKTANLEPSLLKIKMEVTQSKPKMYVPLMSKANPKDSGEKLDPLDKRVQDFLDSKNEVMLILGGSGAGKTTFNQHLERTLWDRYQPNGAIPLFIDLKAMGNLNQIDIVDKRLTDYGFKIEEIRELKEYRHIILICDGYDEAKTYVNIHTRLKGQRWKSFQIVVSCRSQYLATTNYRSYFAPQQPNSQKSQVLALFDEAVVMPFREDQIRNYIDKFLETEDAKQAFGHQPFWSTNYYFSQLSHLKELVKNPYMLQLALTTLPGTVDHESGLPKVLKTRFELFFAFGEQHFQKELGRLTLQRGGELTSDEASAFDILQNDFFSCGIHFSMRLAHAIFVKNGGINLVEYSIKEKNGWKAPFFSPKTKAENILLLGAIQVVRHIVEESGRYGIKTSKDVYSFLHRSIMEFYCSCHLCDIITDPLGEENESHETQHSVLEECLLPTASPLLLSGHPLNHKSIVSEPSIVHFMVEHSQLHPEFQNQLRQVIERSKTDKTVSQAAANAITVLVKAGVQFSGEDLSGIRIPGADLSGGYFDSAILKDANLTDVNFSSAWLRQVDFTGAIMTSVKLGEQPYVMFKDPMAGSLAISHSGEQLALGFENGVIKVFDTSDWSTRLTLRGHSDKIWKMSFSRTGHLLASASTDTTIRIWDLEQIKPCRVLSGHMAPVKAIIFSPDGSQVASASTDKTVRTWKVDSESTSVVLDTEFVSVGSITWSVDGLIASGSRDGIVRMWNSESGEVVRELRPSSKAAASTIFTPDGKCLITCASSDVYLWHLETDSEPIVLKGHAEYVASVTVSRDGLWIASASSDQTVRIWDGRSGAPVFTLTGHTMSVGIVLFLDDHKLVSFAYDDMMRVWDLSQAIKHDGVLSGITPPKDSRHGAPVSSVVFSLDGSSIVTGSLDKSVKEWDITTGGSKTIVDFPCQVLSVSTASDNQPRTVQDWDEDMGEVSRINAVHTQTVVLDVAFTPEGHPVALTTATDKSLLYSLEVKGDGVVHVDAPLRVASNITMTVCSPCGRWIALGESSGNIQLWDRRTNMEKGHLIGHTGEIKGLVFSHDGQQLASRSGDMTGRVWKIEDLLCKGVLEHWLEAFAFSPCGTMVAWSTFASISYTERDHTFWCTIHIWDLASMQRVHALQGHDSRIGPLAWSSEGILSCDDEGTVRLWKWQEPSWSCVAIVRDFSNVVRSVGWNPDASTREFVAGCHNGSVSVWVVTEDKQDNSVSIRLKWSSESRLTATATKITDAVGLDSAQRTLLRQKGAIDDSALPDEAERAVIGPE